MKCFFFLISCMWPVLIFTFQTWNTSEQTHLFSSFKILRNLSALVWPLFAATWSFCSASSLRRIDFFTVSSRGMATHDTRRQAAGQTCPSHWFNKSFVLYGGELKPRPGQYDKIKENMWRFCYHRRSGVIRHQRRSGVIQHQSQIHGDEQKKHRVVSQGDKHNFDVTVCEPGGHGHQRRTQESSSFHGFIFQHHKTGEKMRTKKGLMVRIPASQRQRPEHFISIT